jgi:hypothetical protein
MRRRCELASARQSRRHRRRFNRGLMLRTLIDDRFDPDRTLIPTLQAGERGVSAQSSKTLSVLPSDNQYVRFAVIGPEFTDIVGMAGQGSFDGRVLCAGLGQVCQLLLVASRPWLGYFPQSLVIGSLTSWPTPTARLTRSAYPTVIKQAPTSSLAATAAYRPVRRAFFPSQWITKTEAHNMRPKHLQFNLRHYSDAGCGSV